MSISGVTLATRSSYWQLSRAPRYSLLFALPLFVFYELLAVFLAHGERSVRNGADVILQSLFTAVAGAWGPPLFMLCLIGGGLWLVVRDMRAHSTRLRGATFVMMLGESVALAWRRPSLGRRSSRPSIISARTATGFRCIRSCFGWWPGCSSPGCTSPAGLGSRRGRTGCTMSRSYWSSRHRSQYCRISFALSRSLNLWIFPVAVFGSSSTNTIHRGYL